MKKLDKNKIMTKLNQMEEKFEYGEWVMVRVHDSEKWEKRQYIDTLEFGDTGLKWYCTHWKNKGPNNHEGQFTRWSQIRKIQLEPELPAVPHPEPAFISNQGMFLNCEEAVMELQQRMDKFEAVFNAIKHINEQFD